MAASRGRGEVGRPHDVRDRVLAFQAGSDSKLTNRSVSFLLATVESTERLGALASEALFPE